MSDEFALQRVGATTVRIGDLVMIGRAVLNLAGASVLMRHGSPAGTARDYILPGVMHEQIACDFARWSGGFDPEAAERLTSFLHESGWIDHQAAGLGDAA